MHSQAHSATFGSGKFAVAPLCGQDLHLSMVQWSKVRCWHMHFQHVNVCSACREQDLENRLRRYFGANVTQSHLKMAEAPAGERSC